MSYFGLESPEFSLIALGFVASLAAGVMTGVGALPIFIVRRISPAAQTVMLGLAAGVMLAASVFSLILPGLESAKQTVGNETTAVLIIIASILIGALALWAIHAFVPHEHFIAGREGIPQAAMARIWLFVIAIAIHNFPEGLAVGVGFGGGRVNNGFAIATGIGLQNIPEGLAVAVSLLSIGYSKGKAFSIALLTGLVEPIGGLVGITLVTFAEALLPWGMGFAAGAMLFVISDEIIPETHRKGFATHASFALMVGFVMMMFLDVTLG
jgi:ZIP family zinc transporter